MLATLSAYIVFECHANPTYVAPHRLSTGALDMGKLVTRRIAAPNLYKSILRDKPPDSKQSVRIVISALVPLIGMVHLRFTGLFVLIGPFPFHPADVGEAIGLPS